MYIDEARFSRKEMAA